MIRDTSERLKNYRMKQRKRVKEMEEGLEKGTEERTKLEWDTKQAIDCNMREKEQVRSCKL